MSYQVRVFDPVTGNTVTEWHGKRASVERKPAPNIVGRELTDEEKRAKAQRQRDFSYQALTRR